VTPPSSALATKTLYEPLFTPFCYFLRQQRAEDSLKCVFLMACFIFYASLVGQKKQQGIFLLQNNEGLTINDRRWEKGKKFFVGDFEVFFFFEAGKERLGEKRRGKER
jgi:hypothetical protein